MAPKEPVSTAPSVAPKFLQTSNKRGIFDTDRGEVFFYQDIVLGLRPVWVQAGSVLVTLARLSKAHFAACRHPAGAAYSISGRVKTRGVHNTLRAYTNHGDIASRSPWEERMCSTLGTWTEIFPVAPRCQKPACTLVYSWKRVRNVLSKRTPRFGKCHTSTTLQPVWTGRGSPSWIISWNTRSLPRF